LYLRRMVQFSSTHGASRLIELVESNYQINREAYNILYKLPKRIPNITGFGTYKGYPIGQMINLGAIKKAFGPPPLRGITGILRVGNFRQKLLRRKISETSSPATRNKEYSGRKFCTPRRLGGPLKRKVFF